MSAAVSEPSFTLSPVTASALIFAFVTAFFFSWLAPTVFFPEMDVAGGVGGPAAEQ